MPNRRWLSALYFFPLLAAPQDMSHGTALAIVRTNEEIVVAADSRVTDENRAVLPDTCKIRRSGGLYFSAFGQVSWRKVDFIQVVDKSLSASKSLAERMKTIKDDLVPLLDRALQSDPSTRDIAADQGSIMGVAVYGFDHGILVLYYIRFALKDSTHVDPQIHECPGVDCPDGRAVVTAPHAGGFDWSIPSMTGARQWVQAEINKRQFDIGGPLQLLRIDRNGKSNWIEKPNACKDQK
jgi:hypothetical protein